jgi:hypothetical protein
LPGVSHSPFKLKKTLLPRTPEKPSEETVDGTGRFAARRRQHRTLTIHVTVNTKAFGKWIVEVVIVLRAILKIDVISILCEIQLLVRILMARGNVMGVVPSLSNNSMYG